MNKKMFRNVMHKKVAPALLVLLASASLSTLPNQGNIHASTLHASSSHKTYKYNPAHHARRVLKVLINRNRRNRRHLIRTNGHRYSHHYRKSTYQHTYKLSTKRYHKSKIRTASHIPVLRNKHMTQKQARHQRMISHKRVRHIRQHTNDNIDKGLTNADKRARAAIVYLESRGEWNASNGECYGRFQLLPQYLGWTHGHLNLNHKHQVEVANAYVASRYGSWKNALRFHLRYGYY